MNAPARRPNILFVITDQQRADHVGFAGNPVVRTPNLDGLAARGMVFDRAWVANPVCMPNRASIITGRMPTAHGVIFNDRSLDWGAGTFIRSFREAGYRTALIGKSHLQHGMSRNSVVEIDQAPAFDDPWPDGWDQLEDLESYANGAPAFPDDFYGFDHAEIAIDHGARLSGHHLLWALEKGGRYEDLLVPYSPESPAKRRSPRWWQIYEPPYGPELHSTTFVTERTISFIEEAAGQGKPWLAWASFPDPHHPTTPPGEWFDRHRPEDMELPVSIDDPLDDAPKYLQMLATRVAAQQRGWVSAFGASDHEMVKEFIAATYGLIEMIDDGVGQILSTIERLGQMQDTIVVFTSDHGDMMGEHRMVMKGFIPYRGTTQVPMVIVDPTRAAGRTDSLACSTDLCPTLLELAGLPGHYGIQGRSLVPVLEDPSVKVRDHVLIEDDAPPAVAERGRFPAKTRTVVLDNGLKYSRLSTGEEQLFDLVADPHEMQDLKRVDAVRRAEAVEQLMVAMLAVDDDARGTPIGRRSPVRTPVAGA